MTDETEINESAETVELEEEVMVEDSLDEPEELEEDESEVEEASSHASDDEIDTGLTKEVVAEATDDLNAIYKEGAAAAKELKEAFDDIKSAFDFGSFFKK